MGWRDRQRQASFRGVAFEVDGHDHGFGRRVDVHEYVSRAGPWAEDLGRETRRFSLDAYVLGEDYDQARDALIAALEAAGPGTLIHPWLGTRTVVCLNASVREDILRGGEAGFRLEFIETGPNTAPDRGVDTRAVAQEAAAAVRDHAVTGFAEGFSIAGAPGFLLDAASDLVGQATGALETMAGQLAGKGAGLAGLMRQAQALRTQVLSLADRPAQLANGLLSGLRSVMKLAGTPRAALAALAPLLQFGSTLKAILGVTPARSRESVNQTRMTLMVRQLAAAEAVDQIVALDFVAYDEAVEIRDTLAEQIEAIADAAAEAGDDDGWRALETLRQAMVRDVTARGGSLERVFVHRTVSPLPLLVIAHQLYGDAPADLADREADLWVRNGIRHPGFVVPGLALEALTVSGALNG